MIFGPQRIAAQFLSHSSVNYFWRSILILIHQRFHDIFIKDWNCDIAKTKQISHKYVCNFIKQKIPLIVHPIKHLLSNYNFGGNSIEALIFGVIQNLGCQNCSNSNSDKVEWLSIICLNGSKKRNKNRERKLVQK